MDKKHFFLKLNPPRVSFMQDMTDEERAVMQKHIAYWKPYLDNGTLIVYGPVMDQNGGFGMAVVAVDSEEQLRELMAHDPAGQINHYDKPLPMRAVYNPH